VGEKANAASLWGDCSMPPTEIPEAPFFNRRLLKKDDISDYNTYYFIDNMLRFPAKALYNLGLCISHLSGTDESEILHRQIGFYNLTNSGYYMRVPNTDSQRNRTNTLE